MRFRFCLLALSCWGLVPLLPGTNSAKAGPKEFPDLIQLLGHTSANSLAGEMRGYLVQFIPPVLVDEKYNWGEVKLVTRGLKWKGLRPERQKSWKNHGKWRKLRVEAPNLRNTLIFDIRNVSSPTPGAVRFTNFISFDTRIYYDQQNWRHGLRTWAGSIRARARVKLTTKVEITMRTERKPGKLFDDIVFRVKIYWASFQYDNFVVEHVPGLGGEMAQMLGDLAKRTLDKVRPDIERNLITKANAAIVKAGDTKEVRINLGKLFDAFSK